MTFDFLSNQRVDSWLLSYKGTLTTHDSEKQQNIQSKQTKHIEQTPKIGVYTCSTVVADMKADSGE